MPLILGLATWAMLLAGLGFAVGSSMALQTASVLAFIAVVFTVLRLIAAAQRIIAGSMWARRLGQRLRARFPAAAPAASFRVPFNSRVEGGEDRF